MFGLQKKSLAFKTGILYLVVAIFNITVFIIMVFENQLDLISENAVLNSEKKGISLKLRADNVLEGKTVVDAPVVSQLMKEAKFLGIQEITIMEENGDIRTEVKDGQFTNRRKADGEEIRWINRALTKSQFEDKIFAHHINWESNTIQLYIPILFGEQRLILRPLIYMKDISRLMESLYRQCILIGILLILVHVAMGYAFSRTILRPIRRLNLATSQIAQGDLAARVEIVRDDEIGQLAISFNEMTVALARMQDEAKGANPLTGLPGNISISKELDHRLEKDEKFAVLYCDLDNFKAYNDKYGFSKGDQVILYSRDSMNAATKKSGSKHVFVGHEGGDDFVMIAPVEVWEVIAKSFINNFDAGIAQFYNELDAKNRYIESVNRQGVPMRFPLISVSVAVVSNERRKFKSHAEIVSVAAEMKKYVKSKAGSCYAIDRRTDPPTGGYPVKPLPKDTPVVAEGPLPPGVKPAPIFQTPPASDPGKKGTA